MAASFKVKDIAEAMALEYIGDAAAVVDRVAAIDHADVGALVYFKGKKVNLELAKATAYVVDESMRDFAENHDLNAILCSNARLFFARIVDRFFNPRPVPATAIHPSVTIGEHLTSGEGVSIGANVVIGDHVTIGAGTKIYPGCVIESGVTLGEHCVIKSRVTLADGTHLGNHVQIDAGAVIGGDGFGYEHDGSKWQKIPHIGRVVIGDRTSIGANTTIDRGTIDDTVIAEDVIIDNQVQIAHNVTIGAHTAIAGCVGIAGSATVGKFCMIGGGSLINGHISLADGAVITGGSGVMKTITTKGVYSSGMTVQPSALWHRNLCRLMHLDTEIKNIKKDQRGE